MTAPRILVGCRSFDPVSPIKRRSAQTDATACNPPAYRCFPGLDGLERRDILRGDSRAGRAQFECRLRSFGVLS